MAQEQEIIKPKRLMGTEEASIDDKGRLLFNKKKRERLGNQFVFALGATGCLVAYPEDVWEKICDEMDRHDLINDGYQQYTRLIYGSAEDEMKFDAQGRVVVPPELRKLAGLQQKVFLIGAGDRVEVWDKEEWKKYQSSPNAYGQERREALKSAYRSMVHGGE